MTREAKLVQTLVEMADTLVADYDVVELLTGLTDRCVNLLGVSAAGVMLASPRASFDWWRRRRRRCVCWSCSSCRPARVRVWMRSAPANPSKTKSWRPEQEGGHVSRPRPRCRLPKRSRPPSAVARPDHRRTQPVQRREHPDGRRRHRRGTSLRRPGHHQRRSAPRCHRCKRVNEQLTRGAHQPDRDRTSQRRDLRTLAGRHGPKRSSVSAATPAITASGSPSSPKPQSTALSTPALFTTERLTLVSLRVRSGGTSLRPISRPAQNQLRQPPVASRGLCG